MDMSPELLEQAEKTAKQFATGFRSLAKLCALMRGVGDKKIPKKKQSEQKVPEPVPEIPEEPEKDPDAWEMMKYTDWIHKQNPSAYITDEEMAKLLSARGGVVWGDYFVQSCIRYLVAQDIRSDAYGNQWVRDPSFKKRNGWRPISRERYSRLAGGIQMFVVSVRSVMNKYRTMEEFCEKVCEVNQYAWARKEFFLRKKCTMKDIQKWTQNNHKDLPPLR